MSILCKEHEYLQNKITKKKNVRKEIIINDQSLCKVCALIII